MSIEKKVLITPLIRACKSADKEELQQVLIGIKKTGISKNDLNFVDKNGRTALSHICITSQTGVLDFLLRFKGIDVNRSDNDGNTPLHFAAEAGQLDMIMLMISRNRNLIIDSKNSFGLTPLMKAAIQGRTDCAKRLMLANASPSLKDPVRGFTAKDWAHFCGRKFCADALGELMKKRKAAQLNPYQSIDYTQRGRITVKSSMPAKVCTNATRKDVEDTFKSKLNSIFFRSKHFPSNGSSHVMQGKTMKSNETTDQVPEIKVQLYNDLPEVKVELYNDLPEVERERFND